MNVARMDPSTPDRDWCGNRFLEALAMINFNYHRPGPVKFPDLRNLKITQFVISHAQWSEFGLCRAIARLIGNN